MSKRLVDALGSYVRDNRKNERLLDSYPFLQGVYVGPEAEDANLSKISLPDGSLLRWIPKNKAYTPVVGDKVLMAASQPVIIICAWHGNIGLAEV